MNSRWGIPTITGHGRFVTAIGIDAIGSGVFLPLNLIYFLRATDLTMVQVGTAVSLATLIGLPLSLPIGSIVDHWGAKKVLLASNLFQAGGMAAFLWTQSFWGVVFWSLVVAVGRTGFWGSYGNIVAAIANPGERELWFGFMGALRNVSFALGGLLATLAVTIDSPAAYHSIVALNAVSFLLAFGLLLNLTSAPATPRETRTGGWATVLADRPFRWLMGAQFAYCVSMSVLGFALPLYLVVSLGLPGWISTSMFIVNCLLVGFGQGPIIMALTGRVRWRVLVAAHLAFVTSHAAFWAISVGQISQAVLVAAVLSLAAGAVYTLGEILGGPVANALVVDATDPALRGRYLSVLQFVWNFSTMIAPALFAVLLSRGPAALWLSLGALSLAGATMSWGTGHRMPHARTTITNAAVDVTA